jgi:putative aldouronate transport system substrate-binding protein
MKKVFSVILCVILSVAVIAGCQPAVETSSGMTTTKTTTTKGATTVPSEPVTITIFGVDVRAAQGVALKDNLWAWEELGERLNIKFEFRTSNNFWDLIEPKLNSGQELEDLYALGYVNPAKYIEAGLFLPLDDLISQYGPNISKVLADDPDYKNYNSSMADGKMYTLSETTYRSLLNDVGVYVARKDWLDKLNLQSPKTIDEFYDVCMAIKNGDPNGNGKQDEIAFIADGYSEYRSWIGMSYGLHLVRNDGIWADSKGKVYNEITTENYKMMLTFLNKLYTNQLIPGDIQSMTWETAAEYCAKDVCGIGMALYGNLEGSISTLSAGNTAAKISGFLAPSGPNGASVTESPFTLYKRFAITKYCKNPETVIKLIDYLYSDEGWMLYMYGLENVDYTIIDGEPVFVDAIAKSENGIPAELEKKGMRIQCIPMIYAPLSKAQVKARPQEAEAPFANLDSIVTKGLFMNKLPRSLDEIAIINNADIKTYIKETDIAFITGTKPFSEWDEYQTNLNKLGLGEITAVYQAVYDRNYK